MVVGACIGVFYAVDANFIMRFIIIALGAAVGLGIGRLIGLLVARR